MSNLLEKASILLTPTAYGNGSLNTVLPEYKVLSELVTNGDFSDGTTNWTLDDESNGSISVVDGKLQIVSNGGAGYPVVRQGVSTSIGRKYSITFSVTNNTTGFWFRVSQFESGLSGDTTFYANDKTSLIKFKGEFTAISTISYLKIFAEQIDAGSFQIDDISIKEIQEADFDFSRGSSATRVNEQGLIEDVAKLGSELVTNGNFDANSDWEKINAVIEDGVGKLQESVGTYTRLRQNIGFTGQTKVTYTISFNNTSNTTIVLRDYFGANVIDVPATVGTHTLYRNFITSAINFHSNNLAVGEEIHLDNVSVKEVIDGTDTPKIDYTDGTGALLLEPQSTNKVTQSETFSTWGNTNATITSANLVAPDGSATVIKMSSYGIGGGEHKVKFSIDTNPSTSSIFAKMGEVRYIMNRRQVPATNWQSVVFDLQEGVVVANNYSSGAYPKITDYGNGWYRCEVYYSDVGNNETGWGLSDGTNQNYTATNTTDGLYIWGAQQEDLPFATSYIPTEGSIVTRSADVANNSGNADLFNDSEGVLYAEMAALEDVTASKDISIINDSNNYVIIRAYTRFLNVIVRAEGSTQFFQDIEMNEITSMNKFAVKYKQNDFALWVNGVERLTGTSGNTPTGLNRLAFDSGSNRFYGKVKSVAVFKEALTDVELACLTS